MKNKLFYIIGILLIVLSSCSVGRSLDDKAWIVIDGSQYTYSFQINSNKYIDETLSDKYFSEFLTELKSSLLSFNIETISGEANVNNCNSAYTIQINNVECIEMFETESVFIDGMSVSPEEFDVVSCYLNSDSKLFKIDKNGRNNLLKTCTVSVSKSEQLSNNRTFWQIVFGLNKDNSEYTYKQLDNDVFFDLSRKSARHTAAKISRTIYKNL
ncbi:MAG: hypothetical protein PHP52_13215 [Bacteroidales bacterium]|nr:hypothetical protein [Bacteroidales bacterium]MDD4217497.1 hypothetical protein [Bacteroidales bacterium]MDY0140918.1 hypothetical protein [Bacteroidales bacterium]